MSHSVTPRSPRTLTCYATTLDSRSSSLPAHCLRRRLSQPRLFSPERRPLGEFDASTEEITAMTRGLQPGSGATGAEWDAALAGHSADARAAAEVYALDV